MKAQTRERFELAKKLIREGKTKAYAADQVKMSRTYLSTLIQREKKKSPHVIDLPQVLPLETSKEESLVMLVGSPQKILEVMKGLV